MDGHPNSLGFGVWQSIKSGYTSPTTPLTDPTEIKIYECNYKAMNVILCGLANSKLLKVMNFSFSKYA